METGSPRTIQFTHLEPREALAVLNAALGLGLTLTLTVEVSSSADAYRFGALTGVNLQRTQRGR